MEWVIYISGRNPRKSPIQKMFFSTLNAVAKAVSIVGFTAFMTHVAAHEIDQWIVINEARLNMANESIVLKGWFFLFSSMSISL